MALAYGFTAGQLAGLVLRRRVGALVVGGVTAAVLFGLWVSVRAVWVGRPSRRATGAMYDMSVLPALVLLAKKTALPSLLAARRPSPPRGSRLTGLKLARSTTRRDP